VLDVPIREVKCADNRPTAITLVVTCLSCGSRRQTALWEMQIVQLLKML